MAMLNQKQKHSAYFLIGLLAMSTSFFIYQVQASAVPIVGPVRLLSLTAPVGVPMEISATFSGTPNSGLPTCYFFDDLANRAHSAMTYQGNETSGVLKLAYTFTYPGSHVVYVTCQDQEGNTVIGPVASMLVTPTDIEPPFVGNFGPTSTFTNAPTTFTASYADAGSGVTACSFYVDETRIGPMSLYDQGTNPNYAVSTQGTATITHTFTKAGTYKTFIECRDGRTTLGVGAQSTVTVVDRTNGSSPVVTNGNQDPLPSMPVTSTPPLIANLIGSLIKLPCSLFAAADDPCTVVYYYGADGRRHQFPNEQVFHSWHANFSDVKEVNVSVMNQIPLGKNVTYRPGFRMIKFTASPKVYAVDQGGVLRWITTEQVATSLYGSDWNTKIDDASDVLFTNYKIGDDITSPEQFNPLQVMSEITTAF